MKTANISSHLLNKLGKFNEIFRKDVFQDNIKSHEKPELRPPYRRYIFQKTTRGEGGQLDPPRQIRVKIKCNCNY